MVPMFLNRGTLDDLPCHVKPFPLFAPLALSGHTRKSEGDDKNADDEK
jgi:hypothetical protein